MFTTLECVGVVGHECRDLEWDCGLCSWGVHSRGFAVGPKKESGGATASHGQPGAWRVRGAVSPCGRW
jgi:hypothetical protein